MNRLKIINIIQNLLAPHKRMPLIIAFLNAVATPLQTFVNWIEDIYSPDVTRRTKWNAQVLLFQKLLNYIHNFGNHDQLIFIDNYGADTEPNYFYRVAEEAPVYFHNAEEGIPVYFMNAVEYEPEFDFVVNYPSALEPKRIQIEATVKKYKTVGTTYLMLAY